MDHDERELRRLLAANVTRYRGTLGLSVEETAELGAIVGASSSGWRPGRRTLPCER